MSTTQPELRELFEAALAQPAAARPGWLEHHCSDPAQRATILRMLAADGDGEESRLLDTPVEQLFERVGEDAPERPAIGTRIGPFTLVDTLGEGGSSIVFRAVREQSGVRQTVALKLLRRGLFTPEEHRRFRAERHALAQLRHPGIAQLVEGGITEAGIPYIALELVEGEPIIEHVRLHSLDLRQRLALFMQVCRAVEAAHRALIVHRDLKPSNVLVTHEGNVKLLDFGIAKLLEPDTDGHATQTLQRAMTPAYAAPEQFHDGPITTATDVYALGVLLAEIMTGHRRGHGDARTPSSQVDPGTGPGVLPAPPARTRRQLRGDLDNIVLKATAEEPERRYASAGAFAEDIGRHLDAQPVNAHPPSAWYRTRKFVTRHRGGVMTTAAFVLAVFAALGIAVWQAGIAREQARLAHDHAQRAEAVRDLLVELFDAEIPSRPRDEMPGTAELLERGTERAMQDLSATPAVQSDLLVALGRVYDHLALPDKGEPVLDAAVAAARRVDPPDLALLGAALSERGELDVSRNRYPQALGFLQEAIALQRQAAPGSLALALSLDRQAHARSQTGAHDAAIADYREALAIRERQLPKDDAEIINSFNSLGNAYVRAGRPGEAVEPMQRAIAGARAKLGENHVKTAHYIKSYAGAQNALRNFTEAAALTAQAVAIERTLYPPGSPDIVNGLNNLGTMNLTLGHLRSARDVLREGRAINRDAGLELSMGQAFVLGNLARVEQALGERDDAQALLDVAIRAATAVVGESHGRTRSLVVQRDGLALLAPGADATAIAARMRDALAHAGELGQFRARSEVEARMVLGLALAATGRDDEAGSMLGAAVDALPTRQIDPLLLPAVGALAQWQRRNRRQADAETLLGTWVDRARTELPATHYALGGLELELAELLHASRPDEAAPHIAAARAAFSELPATHPWQRRLAALEISP
jgi:serine/threonine-protein kinase